MKRRMLLPTLLFAVPVWATQPGERLSWRDIVVVAPTVTVESYAGPLELDGCTPEMSPSDLRCRFMGGPPTLPDGSMYMSLGDVHSVPGQTCGSQPCYRHEIYQTHPDGSYELIAYIDQRSTDYDGTVQIDSADFDGFIFDHVHGDLYVGMSTGCYVINGACPYASAREIIRIRGLETLAAFMKRHLPDKIIVRPFGALGVTPRFVPDRPLR